MFMVGITGPYYMVSFFRQSLCEFVLCLVAERLYFSVSISCQELYTLNMRINCFNSHYIRRNQGHVASQIATSPNSSSREQWFATIFSWYLVLPGPELLKEMP